MSHAERRKNRRIRLVGGGYRWLRDSQESGGGIKSRRRALRRQLRSRNNTPAKRRALKDQLRESLVAKEGW